MFTKILGSLTKFSSKITLVVFLLITQFFFLINGKALFPDQWSDSWQTITLIYFVGTFLFLGIGLSNKNIRQQTSIPLTQAILYFSLAFLITWAVMIGLGISGTLYYPKLPRGNALFTLVFTVFVVAPSEEIIFRSVIPNLLPFKVDLHAFIVSSIIFAIFHYAAYQANIYFMVIAFFISMIWFYANKYTSLATSIGSHAAYNAAVSGAITSLPFLG